ncbi:MAG: TonB-dependent receptor [Pseudomonadota bacterium]
MLDTVEVTARRRVEDAQTIPVAVTAIPEEDIGIDHIDTLEDMAFQSPNTIFNAQGGPLTIRGIGSLGIAGGVDRQPSVGVFLDDIFIARPFGYPTLLNDTERLEVIRGSQATLYGKNTIGGAVNIVSTDPGDGPAASAETSFFGGREFESRYSASANVPISRPDAENQMLVRGYVSRAHAGGYIDNSDGEDVGDTDLFATRLAVKGNIGTATDLKASIDYSRDRDDGGLWFAPLGLANDFKADHDEPGENELDIAGVSARVDHDFDVLTLTSITGVRGHELETFLDGDFTSDPTFSLGQGQTESQRQFSQELRLSGETDWFFLQGGLFYMHERFEADQFFDLASLPRSVWSQLDFDQDTDTYSAFLEASSYVLPSIEVVGGVRFTHEKKDASVETSSISGTNFLGLPGAADAKKSFDNLSPEVAVIYHADDSKSVFAKFSRGFKSGGISPFIDLDGSANEYDPEITTSYEIGAKTSWLGDRLRLNGSLFYIDWQDQQAVIATSVTTRVIRNAAESSSKGLEIEGAFQLTDDLTLNANYGYLDAEYDDFVDDVLGQDFSGNPLPFSSKHSAGVGIDLSTPLRNETRLNVGLDYTYRTSYSFNPDNAFRQDPTHLLDARVGISGEGWSATLGAKNLFDERYLQQYFSFFGGTDIGVAAEGRSVGVTVSLNW